MKPHIHAKSSVKKFGGKLELQRLNQEILNIKNAKQEGSPIIIYIIILIIGLIIGAVLFK